MKLAVVLVHYHTPELVAAAWEALEQDLQGLGLSAEWIVVDNGSRDEERKKLRRLPLRLLEPGANLGYAGGANLGVRSTNADLIFLMNPDVMVLPGLVAALCGALESGAAVAGPRFFWDRDRRILLPPTERRTRRDELLRILASRGEAWARRGRARWRRHARRAWTAREPYTCYELSGAFLAFTRRVWEELGGFDEGYRLYFEETDFLERLRARRLEARFVPDAEAVHLYARSTVAEPRSEGWFTESHQRFQRRFYGRAFTAALSFLARRQRSRLPAAAAFKTAPGEPAWLEISASVEGYPAAACRLAYPRHEQEVRAGLPPGTYYLRRVDAAGRELGVEVLDAVP